MNVFLNCFGKTRLLILLLLIVENSFSQCPASNVILNSQNEVDNFFNEFSSCDIITGDLTINSNAITNIIRFENIKEIHGNFTIKETSITGDLDFRKLTYIGGNIQIEKNENLSSISFDNLNYFTGDLIFSANTNLETISGFEFISCVQYLEIAHNYNLERIPNFTNLISASAFNIIENENLAEFSGVPNLENVGGLLIHGNDILNKIPEFNSLIEIGDFGLAFGLSIGYNSKLTRIIGFEKLKRIKGHLSLRGNGGGNAVTIPSFNMLLFVGSILMIQDGMIGIDGFMNLTHVKTDINIYSIGITKINGFNKIKKLRSLQISDNRNLEEINAFDNLVEVSFAFDLSNNPVLKNVNGFGKLKKIGWDAQIGGLDITNLDFLSSLMSVGSINSATTRLGIGNNPSLTDCSGISNLLNYGDIPDRIDIEMNPFPCGTRSEVENQADNDNDGILDISDDDDDNDGILDIDEGNGSIDSDNDHLPDSLDIDSDNDGCNDVIEAGFNDPDENGSLGSLPDSIDANGLITDELDGYSTPLDLNGNNIPDFQEYFLTPKITTDPQSTEVNRGELMLLSVESENADLFQWEISIDNGITWSSIVDNASYSGTTTSELLINSNEGLNYNLYRVTLRNSFSYCSASIASDEARVFVTNSLTPNAGENSAITLCKSDDKIDLFTILGGSPQKGGFWIPSTINSNGIFDPAIDLTGIYTYKIVNSDCNASSAEVTVKITEAFNAGDSSSIEICESSNSINLFDYLLGLPDNNGTWSPILNSGSGIFDPAIDPPGDYTYTVTNTTCPNDKAVISVAILASNPNAGGDGFSEICSDSPPFNLTSLLNGTPDGDGVWSPSLTSGNTLFDPSIDKSGIYYYTVTRGGCEDKSMVEIKLIEPLSAGDDTKIDLCENTDAINLLDFLQGSPAIGGEWSPKLSSGTGIFNPKIDPAGIYNYTINNGICGKTTSEVNVTIEVLPNAGEGGILEICINNEPVDLFDSISGTPDTEGVWTPSLSSGTGIFNPLLDQEGLYTYTVTNGTCGSYSSDVDVVVNVLPDAGEDGNLEICINSKALDLFNSLIGTPQKGGYWSPSLSSGSGIFNPSIDTAGDYTYTVTNGVCGSDTSKVTVTITNVTPISDYEIKIKEFSSNNSLEVIINSNLEYEFSLDGINYQSSTIFNNLGGGDYTVYVQEINGCGILEEKVSILDYPRFFTPNNDGVNDFWQLKGRTEENYSIYIYDRYGKLLKNLTFPESSWDGTYQGIQLPASDYWFRVVFMDGVTKNGHFTLKR